MSTEGYYYGCTLSDDCGEVTPVATTAMHAARLRACHTTVPIRIAVRSKNFMSFTVFGKTSLSIIWHEHGREVFFMMPLMCDHSFGLTQMGNVWRLRARRTCQLCSTCKREFLHALVQCRMAVCACMCAPV